MDFHRQGPAMSDVAAVRVVDTLASEQNSQNYHAPYGFRRLLTSVGELSLEIPNARSPDG